MLADRRSSNLHCTVTCRSLRTVGSEDLTTVCVHMLSSGEKLSSR